MPKRPKSDDLHPIMSPPDPPADALTDDLVGAGPVILPVERVKLYSPDDWEAFVQEWAQSLASRYASVFRIGGSGDEGRDIVACYDSTGVQGEWDNYQCKHYANPLAPSDVWLELGKFCYYTFLNAFTVPRNYYFVAPRDVGTSLFKLLSQPARLRQELCSVWDKKCRKHITTKYVVPLDPPLRAHIDALDFGIFKSYPVLKIIEEHSQTRWHALRFGGGLPPRPKPKPPPADIDLTIEAVYVRQLLDAYEEFLGIAVSHYSHLAGHVELNDHFIRSRIQFYYAESLRSFSRDHVTLGTFENLQDELYSGIIDTVTGGHQHGYARVIAAVQCAHSLALTANVLVRRMHLNDRGGICHQLANDGRLTWVKAS
jgi:hypothetical protein